jgi:hypothetical protein
VAAASGRGISCVTAGSGASAAAGVVVASDCVLLLTVVVGAAGGFFVLPATVVSEAATGFGRCDVPSRGGVTLDTVGLCGLVGC